MKELFNIPNNDFTTSIPFIKPMFYCFKIFIFRTPAFRINNIFCKNFIYS